MSGRKRWRGRKVTRVAKAHRAPSRMVEGAPTRPADTWDWLTLGDLEQVAFLAYLDACRSQSPPKGEPFLVDGRPWASREDFRETLIGLIGQRLRVLSIERGAGRRSGVELWELPDGVSWPEDAPGCRGSAPAAMAHGCAAVAPAVGPAPAQAEGRATALPGDRFFSGPRGQNLPEPIRAGDTPAAQEAALA